MSEAEITIPGEIFDALTSEVALSVARHGYKCPSGFDDDYVVAEGEEDDCLGTGAFYDAICELMKIKEKNAH